MQQHHPFSWRRRLKSFQFAFAGMHRLIQTEHNTRIHAVATLVAAVASILFRISPVEWVMVVLATGFVWTAEIVNTCIERMLDLVTSQPDERVRYIKDLSAAAVLVAAIASFIIGLVIFLPKIIHYVSTLF